MLSELYGDVAICAQRIYQLLQNLVKFLLHTFMTMK